MGRRYPKAARAATRSRNTEPTAIASPLSRLSSDLERIGAPDPHPAHTAFNDAVIRPADPLPEPHRASVDASRAVGGINPALDRKEEAGRPPIASGDAHCDTLCLHFFEKPAGLRRQISQINDRPAFYEPCKDQNGKPRGFQLIVQRPKVVTLHALDLSLSEFGGCVSRFDIACELIPTDPQMTISELIGWLSRNTLLKWRPPGPSLEIDGNYYSVMQSAREDGRKSKRDVLAYKRFSKLDESNHREICQWELRFQRSEAAKREKVMLPSDLITLNPAALIAKHIKFVDMDGFVAKSIRESIGDERQLFQERHQMEGMKAILSEAARASFRNRVKSIWQRGCQCRAQAFKDHHPLAARRIKSLRGSILIPDQLSWPDQHRMSEAAIENPMEILKSPPSYRIDMSREPESD